VFKKAALKNAIAKATPLFLFDTCGSSPYTQPIFEPIDTAETN
jgi:hypothetical protein